ncbi:1348_t:CDS:10, partial [Acaulospora colombiana]
DGTVSSVARNRVTFMRYLTKLCDQLVCMISDEDSENLILNNDEDKPPHIQDGDDKDFESHNRLFAFSVEQTDEQEETAKAKPGFMARLLIPFSVLPVQLPESGVPSSLTHDILQPCIVAGETSLGFLQVEFLPKQLNRDLIDGFFMELALRKRISPNIALSEDLDAGSLKLLLENDLWSRCGNLEGQWAEQREKDEIKLATEEKLEMIKRQDQIDTQVDRFRITMPLALVKMALKYFPTLAGYEDRLLASVIGQGTENIGEIDAETAYFEVKSWLEANKEMTEIKRKEIETDLRSLENERATYATMKTRFPYVWEALKYSKDLTEEDKWRLIDLIRRRDIHFRKEFINITQKERSEGLLALFFYRVQQAMATITPLPAPDKLKPLPIVDDVTFCASLDQFVAEKEVFREIVEELKELAVTILETKIQRLSQVTREIKQLMESQMHDQVKSLFLIRRKNENKMAWQKLKQEVSGRLKSEPQHNGLLLTVRKLTLEENPWKSQPVASLAAPTQASLRFTVTQLEVKEDDIKAALEDKNHGSIQVYVYIYDLETKTLNPRGAPINITRWYSEQTISFTHLVFISGSEELLIAEENGTCRIFSLITETFRLVDTLLIFIPTKFCPDHTTLSLAGEYFPQAPALMVLAYLSRSISTELLVFGAFIGHLLALTWVLTFLGLDKYRPHPLWWFHQSRRVTINNSLVDCHAEVWTRFPVYATIRREVTKTTMHHPRSINFISPLPSLSFVFYFSNLIREFQAKTRKPTGSLLEQITIYASPDWDPALNNSGISELQAGEWLVGMFCLIPIHLAITKNNRFIPLKDGVLSPEFERSLLGANVAQISESYSQTLGEQSVGKSFALNHFVDTSFALVCQFDSTNFFCKLILEGAPQCASFQSSTNVLDPASNPGLFNATLGIIIKDVIDSDTKEIVNEFKQKFQRIVHKEKADNFISKLHRGRVDIIPWPVIESSEFYECFGIIKTRLDRQVITHKHAGTFLSMLKMLMAKLKPDLSRFQTHYSEFGNTKGGPTFLLPDARNNFDTDEILPNEDGMEIFYLGHPDNSAASHLSLDACLRRLRMSYTKREERFHIAEDEFFNNISSYLHDLVNKRLLCVSQWIKANTERFGERAEIVGLLRMFDFHSKELRANIDLCGSKCSFCGLLCLEHKQHEGKHDCQTSH